MYTDRTNNRSFEEECLEEVLENVWVNILGESFYKWVPRFCLPDS